VELLWNMLKILRLAKGEITKEEYFELKKLLVESR
jgi:uncharacterized membrane protein